MRTSFGTRSWCEASVLPLSWCLIIKMHNVSFRVTWIVAGPKHVSRPWRKVLLWLFLKRHLHKVLSTSEEIHPSTKRKFTRCANFNLFTSSWYCGILVLFLDTLGGVFFCKNSHLPARMISDSLEVQKTWETETQKGVHVRFEPGTLKSRQKLSFPARPLDLTPRVRREWKQKQSFA